MTGPLRWLFAGVLAAALVTFDRPPVAGQNNPDPRSVHRSGLVRNEPGAFPGCTLLAPLQLTTVYLVDMTGQVVHRWHGRYTPAHGLYLLDSGNLLRTGRDPGLSFFGGGGTGGRIQEVAWDGTVVWEYVYSSDAHLQHHDIEPLPNGNVLLIAWEKKTRGEAFNAGRDPKHLADTEFWPDHVVEVRPTRPLGGEIVWQWHVWDHLIQEFDPTKQNYGRVADHPELVDINGDKTRRMLSDEEVARLTALGYIVPQPDSGDRRDRYQERIADWTHINSIDYNPELDQIVLSVRHFNEIWVIDHSTTTEEAVGHSGGDSGRGGDLLYRWGNPQTYGAGLASDQRLFEQHDAQWIPTGWRDAGNLTVFNNGGGRPGGDYSSVDEIRPPITDLGQYRLSGAGTFGPDRPVWSYGDSEGERFFAAHLSGAERLPNGNTLICSGERGRVFEVTPDGRIVWELMSPFASRHHQRDPAALARATRVPLDHPGLSRLRQATEER